MARQGDSMVLVVDDDKAVGMVLLGLLRQAGIDADMVESGEEALRRLDEAPIDVILTDLRMPNMDGMALLKAAKARVSEIEVILLTAHGSVPLAVEAMRAGAADFLLKPFEREEVLYTVKKALARAKRQPSDAPKTASTDQPVGRSAALRECTALVEKAAKSTATVLLRGETGTGKEVMARAIHAASGRTDEPFVAVHCAALPDALLESELFGYEKGAFTGATGKKPGRVELARSGTLFLDEIGDISPSIQVKLLRLLQQREYEPLGGVATVKTEARFIAATHRDLESLVREGDFREDLFYRLNVVPIRVPPLRERPEDIGILAAHFCAMFAQDNGRPSLTLDDSAVTTLAAHAWPGNVRELQNIIERLVVFVDGDTITGADVALQLGQAVLAAAPATAAEATTDTLRAQRDEAERKAVVDALDRARGNRTKAARLLGISRRTLYNRLSELHIHGA